MLSRPEQLWKGLSSKVVTEAGRMSEVRPVQPPKANSQILVTELGMVIDVKVVISWNAP